MGKLAGMRVSTVVMAAAVALTGCGGGGGDGDGEAVDGATATGDGGGDSGDGGGGGGAEIWSEEFGGGGAAWPSGWNLLGGVDSAVIESERGRLVPVVSGYTLARMGHALPAGTVDVDVTFTLSMAEPGRQGVGFYVRQNGGYLRQSATHGAGYAVFVEAFRGPQIGVWRERDGVEEPLRMMPVPAIVAGQSYQVRFRCIQSGAETTLAARLWPAGSAEPSTWTVTATDATAALQNVAGDLAVDAWNTATPGNGAPPGPIHVDDIVVTAP